MRIVSHRQGSGVFNHQKVRAMTKEEKRKNALDYIKEDELRGFFLGAWWMQEQLAKWISVEERLPKNNDSVLVYGHCKEEEPDYIDYIVMATYYNGVFDTIDATAHSGIMVVHCWMPLPQKPNV